MRAIVIVVLLVLLVLVACRPGGLVAAGVRHGVAWVEQRVTRELSR